MDEPDETSDYDDSPWTKEELEALAWETGKHAGWEEMDEYDSFPEECEQEAMPAPQSEKHKMGGFVISRIATSHNGSVIALGESQKRVAVFDLRSHSLLSTFSTSLDFSGGGFVITSDGKNCIVGSWRLGGIAAYATRTGREIWRRRDLGRVSRIRVSQDDSRLICGITDRSLHVLDRHTGNTIETWRAVKRASESPYEPVEFLEKRHLLVLRTTKDNRVTSIPRLTFAVLSTTFGPKRFCVSESTGSVRCVDTTNGSERWRCVPPDGTHFLRLAYCESARSFVGVLWPYNHGGSKWLLRFDPKSGYARELVDLGEPVETEFCRKGSRLITSDGAVWDVPNGRVIDSISIP